MFLGSGWPPSWDGIQISGHFSSTYGHMWTSYVGLIVRISALTRASPAPCTLKVLERTLRSLLMFSHIGIPEEWKKVSNIPQGASDYDVPLRLPIHERSLQMKVKKVLAAGGWLCVLDKERRHWWVCTMREFIMRDRETLLWMQKSVRLLGVVI